MSTAERKVNLRTADEKFFEVEESVAMEFATLKSFFEENPSSDSVVPLPNVSSQPLDHVIAYCRKKVELTGKSGSEEAEAKTKEDMKKFCDDFVKGKDNDELKEMILAANYLDVKYLLDVLNQTVADRIKNKSVEWVRKFFGVENDFTPEEEERIRQENSWAFDGVDED